MTTFIEEPSLENELQRRRHSLQHGYIPTDRLVVDPSLEFWAESDDDVDVITYEVIRSKLWNLNIDHGDTIRRVSGSNLVVEGYDFNCAVTTEIGDAVTLGAYSMFFAGCADEVIKWTLEHRSMNVGVHEGDIWLQDDPWVGTNHQMDVAVYAPVFHEGKLFAWMYNCVHQREIGGSQPGGFIQDASDVFLEPTFMPPIKLADHGVVREDIVDAWVRRSRLPDLMVLELNSQVAGLRFAQQRFVDMIARYGAPTLRGVMRRMIRTTANATAARLARLPDAVWRDERYVAGARQDDPKLYKICMSFEKIGDRLLVSNAGTDPAVGSFNIAPGVFRATVLNGLQPTLGYDQYLCAAGILQQLDFEFEQGAITSASHPSAVSTSLGTLVALTQAHNLGAKMVSGAGELSTHAFASPSAHTTSNNAMFGTDQYGNPFADLTLDTVAGGVGAFNHRDGIDHGGPVFAVAGRISDVEKYEQTLPFLYLYRRELPESGGHGRWRGGVTFACAWVGHKTANSFIASGGLLKSVTQGMGICGGYPATGGYNWHATDTAVQAWLGGGRVPGDPAELRELAPHGDLAPVKKYDNRLGVHDVFEVLPNPGAGWGDPLQRRAELVALDLRDGRVDEGEAASLYGVVLDTSGEVDEPATASRREQLCKERLVEARVPRLPASGTVRVLDRPRVIEGVALVDVEPGTRWFACAGCGQVLSPAHAAYRLGCAELDIPMADISPLFVAPIRETGEELVMRRLLCPACGVLIDTYVCRPDDVPFMDVVMRGAAH
ncbi:MAG: hypothetical protein JWL83_3950 [Actinomycetia bacterium]|nr:hypothetical protein [Actinomycetes bacterium]